MADSDCWHLLSRHIADGYRGCRPLSQSVDGVLDDFDDLMFPQAEYLMGAEEWAYWRDPATVDTIGEARASFAVGAARRLAAIEDRVRHFRDGEEVLPGVAAVATFGHTPGHMSFELRQGTQAVLIGGDAIGNHHPIANRHADSQCKRHSAFPATSL